MAQPKDPSGLAGKDGMRIDTQLVRELAELLSSNELTEIEFEEGNRRIRVKRDAPNLIAAAAPGIAAAPALSAPPMQAKEEIGAESSENIAGNVVKCPMVGTAYLSPEPGAGPFIEIGKSIKAGDTLLIVEAMKVMNPITAPQSGTIRKIMVADAQPVEFDQPLVIIG